MHNYDILIAILLSDSHKIFLCHGINLLGTEEKNFDQLTGELQKMGAAVGFQAGSNSFDVCVTGFDSTLDNVLDIVSDLMDNMKGDRKKLRTNKFNELSAKVFARSDMNELEKALYEKVCFGNNSSYLTDKGKFNDDLLLGLFKDVQKVECDILYSGSLDADKVTQSVQKHFDINDVTVPSNAPVDFQPMSYDEPQVFFLEKKDASQSQCRCLINVGKVDNLKDRVKLSFYNYYLGGGSMMSLLFQEIREFRSMAYTASSALVAPSFKNKDKIEILLDAFVGTQSDKTVEALEVMDSLITDTPFMETKLRPMGREMINTLCSEFPDFRHLPASVSSGIRNGHAKDSNPVFVSMIESADTQTLESVWNQYVAGKNKVWTVIGASSKVDMEGLEKFGPVTRLKVSDVMK